MYKVSVIGNTRLTYECLTKHLCPNFDVVSLFSLDSQKTLKKVNGVNLQPFCREESINFYDHGNWQSYHQENIRLGVDIIFVLGDSRIIPDFVIEGVSMVVGNHGAILPDVKGGASLTWGRMLNSGTWGVSLFKIAKGIDTGPIISTKSFEYPLDCSMDSFVNQADKATVQLVGDLSTKLSDGKEIKYTKNQKSKVKIVKHTDSEAVVNILKICTLNDLSIYLPPRTPSESQLRNHWNKEFKKSFKLANDFPYPQWSENEPKL